jgi:hypothetical protein
MLSRCLLHLRTLGQARLERVYALQLLVPELQVLELETVLGWLQLG